MSTDYVTCWNNIFDQYTLISLNQGIISHYGKPLQNDIIKMIIIISKQIINKIISDSPTTQEKIILNKAKFIYFTKNDKAFIKDNTSKILEFSSLFNLNFINIIEENDEYNSSNFHIKYRKYKYKYLKLQSMINHSY